MRDAAFTEVLQIGIVVRDLEATMGKYTDEYGIGPWQVQDVDSGDVQDLREYGERPEHSWRVAVAGIGGIQWELIQPLDDRGMYARFLAEKGPGVHHIAVAAANFEESVAEAERGPGLVGSGRLGGTRVAYLGTDRDLGVILEIFGDTSGGGPS